VAEDVEKVNSGLIVRDKEGKPYSVRYDAMNAMLLNEFLKEHRKVEEQETTIAELKKDFRTTVARQQKEFDSKIARQQEQIEALSAGLQRVNEEFAVEKRTPQIVLNNQ
jgi:trimeric autotransporter adhesin